MKADEFELGDVIGVRTRLGPNFYVKTEEGLDGPFLNRECTERPPVLSLPRIRKNNETGEIERHHDTGKRRRNKAITMADGQTYRTDTTGAIRRDVARLSKQERRALKHGQKGSIQKQGGGKTKNQLERTLQNEESGSAERESAKESHAHG